MPQRFSGSERIFSMLHTSGMLKMLLYAMPRQLTVLGYHRIDDVRRPGFDTFTPNVSATPEGFRQQMEHLKRHYNVIRCEELAKWRKGECELPARAAIITFDDGYRDNLDHAFPILRELGLPATIFLCTDHIGTGVPFFWDQAAYCFRHTAKKEADLPLLRNASWPDELSRERIEKAWVERAKRLSEEERGRALRALEETLGVRILEGAFAGLYLNWDQVRELSRNGIEFGAHTASHTILTAVPLGRARKEIGASKEKVEAETGKRVISFAYPNGGAGDFSPEIMNILRGSGIEVAFTLMPGPTTYAAVKRHPLAIRRIFVGRTDTLPRFAAKLAGAARLKQDSQY